VNKKITKYRYNKAATVKNKNEFKTQNNTYNENKFTIKKYKNTSGKPNRKIQPE
jgi:hypothetical protein